ncbi:MAG: formylglycine-generating enzyme family protein [Treponema sp.]|nr:formylglycine-generating enzyme family protein [Treponema sp.]
MKRTKGLWPLAVIGGLASLALAFAACDNGNKDSTHAHDWGDWTAHSPASILSAAKERRICKLDGSHFEEQDVGGKLAGLITTVEVASGFFMYGRDGESGGEPETVASFHIGKYAVTQAQWQEVMDNNPSYFNGTNAWNGAATETFNRNNLPVEQVSWYDALVFANRLSVKDGLDPAYRIKGSVDPADWGDVPSSANDADWDAVEIVPGANGWRLPSERQWEFAAKGGTLSAGYSGAATDRYFLYSGSNNVEDVAWYWDNSNGRTHEVGKKGANELGLYDMSGNVWEWCQDRWSSESAYRVVRGGSWSYSAGVVRSAFRGSYSPSDRGSFVGFRLARP